MRTQTARRLRGRIDLLVGGSAWWSIPPWPPAALTRRMEARNAHTAAHALVPTMARLVGAPVVHAAHCGPIACPLPLSPIPYRGRFEGGATICAADGTVLAHRRGGEGPGIVVADVEPGRTPPADALPARGFWLHRRGAIPALAWQYQRVHGRRWYRRHVLGRD
jgi:hypothetical protein